MKFISPAREAADLNLPAFEFSTANVAHPLLIERIPLPESIACTQGRKSIVEVNIRCHNAKALCASHGN
jgi:hypothetical protein